MGMDSGIDMGQESITTYWGCESIGMGMDSGINMGIDIGMGMDSGIDMGYRYWYGYGFWY